MSEQRTRWFIRDSKFGRKDSRYYDTEAEAREALTGRRNRRRYSVDEHRVDQEATDV